MLPPGGLSEAPQRGNFLTPDDDAPLFNFPGDLTPTQTPTDWELAGRALNDPTAGLQVQNWTFYVDGPNIMVKPDDGPATVVYSPGAGVLELAGSFDSNMNPCIAWTGADLVTWLRWWNPQTVSYALSTLPALRSPRLTLDDKRASQVSNRDILLFYIRNEAVCYRQQRDRYQVEYTLYPLPQGYTRIGRVGMSDRNRMQLELVLACTNGTAGVPVDATGCNNPDWCTAPPPNAPAAPPGAVSGAWDVIPCLAPCVITWTPEEYPWEPPPGRELQPVEGGWYYTGDYAGCDDCGSALLGDTAHILNDWTLSFSITVYGTSFDSVYSSRQRVITPGGTLYWDGTAFVAEYPSSYHLLPAGTYNFSFAISVVAETKIQVMMGLCNDPGIQDPECPYTDRPWLLHNVVATGCRAAWDQEIFHPCPGAV